MRLLMNRSFFFSVALVWAFAGPQASARTIAEVARAEDHLSLFLALAQSAGLVETLDGSGPLTIFAPSNAALEALPPGAMRDFLQPENRMALTAVLTYHVIEGALTTEALEGRRFLETLNGQRLPVRLMHGGVRIGGVELTRTEMPASNGVIHVIDGLLTPAGSNLAELARAAGSFQTLLAAVEAAGLTPALTAAEPLTVFAPTDEAFARLPAGTVDMLLEPRNRDQLTAVLTYHLLPQRQYSDDILAQGRLETLQGERVEAQLAGGRLEVNGHGLLESDLEAANGVVHVLDSVLLPPGLFLSVPAESPAAVIRRAINQGAPLFNQGQIEACAAIYEAAVSGLLTNPHLPAATTTPLRDALAEARHLDSARERAWALRRGMDAALAVLNR